MAKIFDETIEVDFKEVTEEMREAERQRNLPATLPNVPKALGSHITGNAEAMERLRENIALNKELGLESQQQITVKKAVSTGIDSLYSQHDYPEINRAGLIALFGIKNNSPRMVIHNALQALKLLAYAAMSFLPLFVLYGYGKGTAPIIVHAPESFLGLLSIIGYIPVAIGAILCYGFYFRGWNTAIHRETYEEDWRGTKKKREGQWIPSIFIANFLRIGLITEAAGSTTMEIPYGAKLRMKEAKDKGLFDSFHVVHPNMEQVKLMADQIIMRDPALIGSVTVHGETRSFLISYWDIEKDRERLLVDMARFKKMKV